MNSTMKKQMSIFKRVKDYYDNEGIGRTMMLPARRLNRLFNKYIFSIKKGVVAERDLSEPIEYVQPTIDVEIKEMQVEHLPLLKDIVTERKMRKFKERLLSKSRVGFIVFHEGEVAYYTWISITTEDNPFDIEVKIGEHEGIIIDSYTLPKFRGNRIHTFMSAKRLEYLEKMGCHKVYAVYYEGNAHSRKAHLRNGYKEKKKVTVFTIFGLSIHRWKDIKENN